MEQHIAQFHKPLSDKEKQLASQITDIAIAIHKSLGPGLLESVYEKCFCYELKKRNIPYMKQQCVDIFYDDLIIGDGLRIDIMVDDLVIIELQAQDNQHPVGESQL